MREAGAQVGDYRLVAPLGAGAWGEVFKAEHVITRRIDAVKLLGRTAPAALDSEQRYLREIRLQASLDHPNIAAVHNAFRTPDGIALVMELVEGEPLDAILARGRLPLATGAGYVLQTLAALEYAHSRGVVHRDVKPSNILITPRGTVKLTDFGLARREESPRLTRSGEFAGSPYYMSPEQVVGLAPADARSDLYSVGVVLYEIAVGRRPFEDASAFQVMLKHRDCAPPPPLELEPALREVILKALEKEPAKRFASAAEFRAALERALSEPRAVPPARRRARRWTAAALAASLAAAGAPAVIRYFRRAPAPLQASPELFRLPTRTLPPDMSLLPPVPKWKETHARAKAASRVEPPPPARKRHPVWRALGRIPGPWKAKDEQPQR